MVLPSTCCCFSNSLPTHVPSQGWFLPRKQLPRIGPQPAANLHSSNRLAFHRLSLRATTSEDASSGANQYVGEDRDTITASAVEVDVEEKPAAPQNSFAEGFSPAASNEEPPPPDGQAQSFELLENIDLKFDSEDTLSIALYGSGALVALWLASAVVGAIDSIPLLPKLLEVVGLGYTVWFTWRYLIFKKNREEFLAKISELKQEVLGSKDD
ncbi:protein CURVATURE THYLAKOID 1D, chloroplastic [Punica granatum]|uniref:Uncharacterized protein n=2 Tax=Punica granatum TaxID=22663 RepID=A0A2I0IEK8_PUNGR|nr:protein CURVATURE THYLAKOID 1D, chloroplastic [Punica granatum]PKI42100.1 hypothetical protein CRG98_037553 [Punica granatum]